VRRTKREAFGICVLATLISCNERACRSGEQAGGPMIDIDSIRTQITMWQQRWPHLALVALEAHPSTVQALSVTKVDGLLLEAAPWMTSNEHFYFLYRRDGQARRFRIRNDDAEGVLLLGGEPGKP
jgi:hypothetical protein